MDLFEHARKVEVEKKKPLAVRMRPRTLDEFVGQKEVLGPGTLLRRAILNDQLQSLILYGPPGSGKTTLAFVIANTTKSHFVRLNAVMATVKDVREIIEAAQERQRWHGQGTVLFLDEIHRFNKAQQDALLPSVEEGLLVLIGATTENPFFTVNQPLLSRSRVVRLERLSAADIACLIRRALQDKERGLGAYNVVMDEEAVDYLAKAARGDARVAFNTLELAVKLVDPDAQGRRVVDRRLLADALQTGLISYDRAGDEHYNLASCFIKSVRGSDVQAALYWLARMLLGGEDIGFIARRLLILASEDIGLADPQALVVASAAAAAVNQVGMPEARIILAEAVVYLATAPKSNTAYMGITRAWQAAEETAELDVPPHLKDANYPGAKSFGYGKDYLYPHDYPGHWVKQQYLPQALSGRTFYEPSQQGYERQIAERLKKWEKSGKR